MISRRNRQHFQGFEIQFPHIPQPIASHGKLEHLIEIAIEDSPQPVYANRIPTHQTGHGTGVKTLDEKLLVGLFSPFSLQLTQKACDWHIRDRKKAVEDDPEGFA